MAAFSRLQLAAALLEYDNDDSNPDAPKRSAQDSAIFAHMRRTQTEPVRPKSTDFLSVALPSDGQDLTERRSVHESRRSRASTVNALRNPFGPDEYDEDSGHEDDVVEEMEVDLASWGLDVYKPAPEVKVPKPRKVRGRAKSETLEHVDFGSHSIEPSTSVRSRAMSLGNFGGFGLGGAFLDAETTLPSGGRPHSVASPTDLINMASPPRPPHLRRPSQHSLIDKIAPAAPLHAIPFPRDDSPRPSSRGSRLYPEVSPHQRKISSGSGSVLAYDQTIERPKSTASFGSRMLRNESADNNPFAIAAPSAQRASRFDPKFQQERRLSVSSREMLRDENLDSSSPGLQVVDQSRQRTTSTASMSSQMRLSRADALDPDQHAPERRRRTYSRMDLMRPKVLIMPSPLQDAEAPPAEPRMRPDGFSLSTDGPPLPANARTTRRQSGVLSTLTSSPSNVQMGTSQSNLSLSQMTFRPTLGVDGQVAQAGGPPIATEDGEQVAFPEPEDPSVPAVVVDVAEGQDPVVKRPAGKLYGRSLIDNLEARKAEIKGKKQFYRGDERPAMMDRSGTAPRASTLIDTTSLDRPTSQRLSSFNSNSSAPAIGRRNSQPLLNLGDDRSPSGQPGQGISKARSVFGVDTLWEREMVKLHQMEADEEVVKKKQELLDPNSSQRGKGKAPPLLNTAAPSSANLRSPVSPVAFPTSPKTTALPPVLPTVQRVVVREAPRNDQDDEDDSDDDDRSPVGVAPEADFAGWESPDEDGARRQKPAKSIVHAPVPADDSDEEDLPLAATIGRAAERVGNARSAEDSDEEQPLSQLLQRQQLGIPNIDFDRRSNLGVNDGDDDDKPLALRASSFMGPGGSSTHGVTLDDDAPLALHPEHQRMTQYHAFAQAQQQQQMMQQQMMQAQMVQAQMHQSMFFGAPSVMGSGFMPPMGGPMMMMPPAPPSPPPMHDPAKFGRVDRWRRDVAVEGPAQE